MSRWSRQATYSRQARYSLDRLFSKGVPVLIGWLVLTALGAVILVSIVAYLTGRSGYPLHELIWESSQRLLDPGGIISSGSSEDTGVFQASMFASSLIGVIALACFIGLVTGEVVKVFDGLRRGLSSVAEKDHILILGWSEHVPMIVSEIATANENRRGRAIVILADRDPIELRDLLSDSVGGTKGSHVTIRRGDPTELKDLDTVGFSESRAIVIAPDRGSCADSLGIKKLLALVNHPRRPPSLHIVMPIEEPDNQAAAKLVGGDEVEVVVFRDVAARIAAQTCCQPGLSHIYTELLDFKGDEIYFQEEPALVGHTFGDALLRYEHSTVIGLCSGGSPVVRPSFETIIRPGDEVIAISQDDHTVRLSPTVPEITADAIRSGGISERRPERTLILGWARSGPTLVKHLDQYVAAGSTATVLAPDEAASFAIADLAREMSHQVVRATIGMAANRATLDALDIPAYDHVVVCGSGDPDPQAADAEALLTLLHLRDIRRKSGARFSLVTEMRDAKNRELGSVASVDDFVVSEHLLSLMLAQLAEQKRRKPVFDDLFDPAGPEIHIRPATDYVRVDRPITYSTVVEAARRRREIAIGFRRVNGGSEETALGFGIVVNPPKSKLVTFGEQDQVIVITES
jgi:voltage-gated potassium channel Kch